MKLCIYCKRPHSSENCPLYLKALAVIKFKDALPGKSFASSSPAPFVGRFGYPFVKLGILAPPENSDVPWLYDDPKFWSAHEFSVQEVVEFRAGLINARSQTKVKVQNNNTRFSEIAKEVGMASRPVDVEVVLENAPVFSMRLDSWLAPMGPSVQVKRAEITSNPKIPTKVEKVVGETELTAQQAFETLYNSGFDELYLSKLLSVGAVGVKGQRKLVPTRWSITAADDILAGIVLEKLKQRDRLSEYLLFSGGYLGNEFLVLLFPEYWSYELFETAVPSFVADTALQVSATLKIPRQLGFLLSWTTDFESFNGRKNYAENCAGGYYAVRLAVAEKLSEFNKQASVLVLRFITPDYSMPLGVWVPREAVRKALQNKPNSFQTKESLLSFVRQLALSSFGVDVSRMFSESRLLQDIGKQQRLSNYV